MTNHPAQRIAGAFLALGSGEVFGRLLAFATTLVIARVLGTEGYGVYAVALAVGLYLAKASTSGLEGVGVRTVAENPEEASRLASAISGVRLVLAVLLMLGAGLVTHRFIDEPDRTVLLISYLALLPVALDLRWVLVGLEKSGPAGWARVLGEGTTLLGVLIWVDGIDRLDTAILCYAAGVVVSTLAQWVALRRHRVPVTISWDPGRALPVLRRGLPIAGQILLGLMIFNADVFFLRVLEGAATVGLYSAAYTPVAFAANLAYAFAHSVLPVLSAERRAGRDVAPLYGAQVVRALAIALPLAVGTALVAGPIIELGFGASYAESAPILAILMISTPLGAITALSWTALNTLGKERWLFIITAGAALLNIVLNLLWIPRFGMTGAAAATVLTEAVRATCTAWVAWRGGYRLPGATRVLRPVLATGVMAAFLIYVEWPALVEIPVAATLYFVAFFAFGGRAVSRPEPLAPRR